LEREFRTLRNMVMEIQTQPTIEQENNEFKNSINATKEARI
jgi:hypothetical protein